MKRRGLLVALLAAPAIVVSRDVAAFRDRNCADFRSQRKAQKVYKRVRRKTGGDPHNLDADNDGVACEELR